MGAINTMNPADYSEVPGWMNPPRPIRERTKVERPLCPSTRSAGILLTAGGRFGVKPTASAEKPGKRRNSTTTTSLEAATVYQPGNGLSAASPGILRSAAGDEPQHQQLLRPLEGKLCRPASVRSLDGYISLALFVWSRPTPWSWLGPADPGR